MSKAPIFILSSALLVLPSLGFGQLAGIVNAAAKKAAAKAATDAATKAAANSAAKAAASSAGRSAARSAGRAATAAPRPAVPSAGTTTYTPHSSTPSATGSTTYTPNSGAVTGGRPAASSTASGSGVVTYTPHTYTPREPARPSEPSGTSSSSAVTYTPNPRPVFGPARPQPVQPPHEVAPVVPVGTTGGDGGLHIGVAPPPVSVVYNPNTGVSTYTPRTIPQNVPESGPAGTYGQAQGQVFPTNAPAANSPAGVKAYLGAPETPGVRSQNGPPSGPHSAPAYNRSECITLGVDEWGQIVFKNSCATKIEVVWCAVESPNEYELCKAQDDAGTSPVGTYYERSQWSIAPNGEMPTSMAQSAKLAWFACENSDNGTKPYLLSAKPPKGVCWR